LRRRILTRGLRGLDAGDQRSDLFVDLFGAPFTFGALRLEDRDALASLGQFGPLVTQGRNDTAYGRCP